VRPSQPFGRAIRRAFRLDVRGRAVAGRLAARDADEEIRLHLDLRVEQLVRRGLTPDAARAEALRRFGPVDDLRRHLTASAARRESRMRLTEWAQTAWFDLTYAARQLRRGPGFTAAVVLTLALVIGANATMFGIVDRLLLRPPAHVVDPGALRRVYFTTSDPAGGEATYPTVSFPEFAALRDHGRGLVGVAAVASSRMSLGRGADAEQVRAAIVTASYFPTLGVRPLRGRFFTAAEDRAPRGDPVAVVSYGFWRQRLGGDAGVLGRELYLGKAHYTVVGVAPKGFAGPALDAPDVWLPMSVAGIDMAGEEWPTDGGNKWLDVVARVAPGADGARLGADLTAAWRRAVAGRKYVDTTARLSLGPALAERGSERPPETRVAAWVLGVAAVVLLVACANVANLLLARGMRRRREIATRLALGVSRRRLAAQLLTETSLLAALGGAGGVLVARWGGALLGRTLLPQLAWDDTPVDARVLAASVAAVLAVALLTAVLPLVQATHADVAHDLRTGVREGGGHRTRARDALLVTQAALCALLLVGAGLFVRSLRNVRGQDLGFDPDRVVAVSLSLSGLGYAKPQAHALYERALDRVRALPGVERAALAISTPLATSYGRRPVVPGLDSFPRLASGGAYLNGVTPEYFATMGTRIVRGRAFTAADADSVPRATIVNETMARVVWPRQDPIGKCVKLDATAPCSTVVGVAQDVYRESLRPEPTMQYYVPLDPRTLPTPMRALFVRAARGADPEQLAPLLRRAVQGLAADLPYANVRPMRRLVDPHVRSWRLGATLFTAFGALALVIAAVGLYSVIAYDVAQRTRELGVRLALGARPAGVVALTTARGVRLAAVGVALGTAAALAAAGRVAPLLFDVSPRDPLVYAAVAATLLGVAVLASLLPARRAARIPPAVTLKAE
jgi:predicted permease